MIGAAPDAAESASQGSAGGDGHVEQVAAHCDPKPVPLQCTVTVAGAQCVLGGPQGTVRGVWVAFAGYGSGCICPCSKSAECPRGYFCNGAANEGDRAWEWRTHNPVNACLRWDPPADMPRLVKVIVRASAARGAP